jgi:hypothetical protein
MVEVEWRVPLARLGFIHSMVQKVSWIVGGGSQGARSLSQGG